MHIYILQQQIATLRRRQQHVAYLALRTLQRLRHLVKNKSIKYIALCTVVLKRCQHEHTHVTCTERMSKASYVAMQSRTLKHEHRVTQFLELSTICNLDCICQLSNFHNQITIQSHDLTLVIIENEICTESNLTGHTCRLINVITIL